jgi:hypothetical protein
MSTDLIASSLPAGQVHIERTLPTMLAHASERTLRRFLEFFTVNIRNANTRAYLRAANSFFRWCEERQLPLEQVQPFHVAASALAAAHDSTSTYVQMILSAAA